MEAAGLGAVFIKEQVYSSSVGTSVLTDYVESNTHNRLGDGARIEYNTSKSPGSGLAWFNDSETFFAEPSMLSLFALRASIASSLVEKADLGMISCI